MRAIRAAFFERHRSSSVDDLQPWGDSAAAPSVEIDFEVGGTQWKLAKRFLQRRRCSLASAREQLDGEAAEHRLAELLGFSFPRARASREEHWGVPGLLWIEQGTAHEVDQAVGHAADYLRKALDAVSVARWPAAMPTRWWRGVRELRDHC